MRSSDNSPWFSLCQLKRLMSLDYVGCCKNNEFQITFVLNSFNIELTPVPVIMFTPGYDGLLSHLAVPPSYFTHKASGDIPWYNGTVYISLYLSIHDFLFLDNLLTYKREML